MQYTQEALQMLSTFIIPDIPSIHQAAGFDFCLVLPGIPPQTRRAAERQDKTQTIPK